ncbi:MAG TPA: glycine cleavage system protein GcvH [Longimicrobiales bacterium]|jgi:glycine cleavage system H protein|nr:glycine cleavage system protein GcvH [Longimicrobiales bacterium]
MSQIPSDLLYSEEHEYLRSAEEDGVYYVGVTDYAQGELGDIVFVELPGPGDSFGRMDVFGTVEAVKAVSDLYMPVGGEIVEVNETLDSDPSLVNSDPYGDGWMIKIRIADASELEGLLDGAGYEDHIG